ncbi:hypothetical protein D3C72_907890 [compost metagenome]
MLFIGTAQVQRQGAAVQLVLAADQRAGLFHVLTGLGRGEVLADGFARQAVELLLEHILGRDHQGQAHDGLLGQLIEQGVQGLALAGFAGELTDMGRLAQLVDHHHGVRLLIEIPQTLVAIRARLLEEQSLHKVVVERQRETIAVIFLRVGHASIERCG